MQSSLKRLSVNGVVRSTGFSKKETGLLEKTVRVISLLEELGEQKPIIIGGFGIRWYTQERFTGKIAGGSPTDLDIAFLVVSDKLKKYMEATPVLEGHGDLVYGTQHVKLPIMTTTPFHVLHLDPKHEETFPLFSDVCFFDGRVTVIPLRQVDFERAQRVNLFHVDSGNMFGVDIQIADPGLLLATSLNYQALNVKRAFRAVMLLASLGEAEFKDAIERYVDIVKNAGLTPDQLKGPLEMINMPQVKKWEFKEVVGKFLEEVQTRMGRVLGA